MKPAKANPRKPAKPAKKAAVKRAAVKKPIVKQAAPKKVSVKKAAVKKAAPKKPAAPRYQDTRELRTLRSPWGLCEWLAKTAAKDQTSQTAVMIEGLRVFLDVTRLKPKPISEERAALMRTVAKLARTKFYPGQVLISDPEPLSPAEIKMLLQDPVAKELYDLACEEMARPTAADLAKA